MQTITPIQTKATCTCMIIARDASNTIIDCLESVLASRCFESVIIVIDTRTKRPTARILLEYAKRYPTIRLLWYKWSIPADFAAVRNYALRYADTQYGFWLDTDDRLVHPGAIRNLLRGPRGKAYNMYYVSPIAGGDKTFDMYQPRLFPLLPGIMFECPVFERIDWSLRRQGIEIVNTDLRPILHSGYLDSGLIAKKNRRNYRIAKRWLKLHKFNDEKRQHLLRQFKKMRP